MTDLEFELAITVLFQLLSLGADGLGAEIHAEAADQFDLAPVGAAEQTIERQLIKFRHGIVDGDFNAGFS